MNPLFDLRSFLIQNGFIEGDSEPLRDSNPNREALLKFLDKERLRLAELAFTNPEEFYKTVGFEGDAKVERVFQKRGLVPDPVVFQASEDMFTFLREEYREQYEKGKRLHHAPRRPGPKMRKKLTEISKLRRRKATAR